MKIPLLECSQTLVHPNDEMDRNGTADSSHGNQCDKCYEVFESKKELIKHMKMVHWKEKQFACKECPKIFARRIGLERHIDGIHLQMENNKIQSNVVCFQEYDGKS